MIVRKFGGTSIGNPSLLRKVAEIVIEDNTIVVLSAISGITNWLEKISSLLYKKNAEEAAKEIDKMYEFYEEFITALELDIEDEKQLDEFISIRRDYLKGFTRKIYNILQEKALLADGEIVSSYIFFTYLKSIGKDVSIISALSFMRIDKDLEPDEYYIEENLTREINKSDAKILVTQGYICRNAYGEIDNLKRGGSDYSATLIGNAIKSSSIEIWTDIDGLHNNDPRHVNNTYPIHELSYEEASELAYFGAKILHPSALLPAIKATIPVILKNTLNPADKGTIIGKTNGKHGIKAVAAKDGISIIRIKSGRMLNAYGYLKKIFEIFEIYKTPIDMITTSEVAVSVTIDNSENIKDIVSDLEKFCTVETESDQTIIVVVGIMKKNKKGYAAQVFDALIDVPIKMISYGATDNNISLLIDSNNKVKSLNAIQKGIFNKM
jgi:aspartate kinase